MIKDVNLINCVQACESINDKWECFHETIADGVNLFVPVKGNLLLKIRNNG